MVSAVCISLFAASCSSPHPTKQLVARCLLQAVNRYPNVEADADRVASYVTICMQAQGYQPMRAGKECGEPDASVDHACYLRAP